MPRGPIERRVPKLARSAWRIMRRTVTNYLDEEGVQWAGAVAFYLVLSVPPLMVAAMSIGVAVVGADTARTVLVDQVARFLPAERDVIGEIVEQTVEASGPAALVAIGFLLFSGSRVFASLIAAINVMWQEIEPPGFLRRQLQRVGMIFTVGLLLVISGVLDLGFALASDQLALPASVRVLAQSQLVPALFMIVALFLLFYLIPRRAATWTTAMAGAVAGAIGLRLAQAIFTTYLRASSGFDSAYGPIAGLAAVLTWALVASSIILLAAQLVAVLNSPDREPRPVEAPRGEQHVPGESQAARRPRPHRRDG